MYNPQTLPFTMKMLMIVVLAAAAVVVSGRRPPPPRNEMFNPLHEAIKSCKKVLMPPHEEMNAMKKSMRDCLEIHELSEIASHSALSPVELSEEGRPNFHKMGDHEHPRHALCFLKKVEDIHPEIRENVTTCAFQNYTFVDGMEFDVTEGLELLKTQVDQAEDSLAKVYLSTLLSDFSTIPNLPDKPDMVLFGKFKKSLIHSCVMNVAEEMITADYSCLSVFTLDLLFIVMFTHYIGPYRSTIKGWLTIRSHGEDALGLALLSENQDVLKVKDKIYQECFI
ncbi:uncharacterized protein LOC122262267 [Penaeus japonicus]|uniref:uncharacterized protein LOC122262267 n=1 Tax=Penaeus japonicus TaxID=27405 RepID=UPI001C70CA3D|nr:uncharacterized protein LOC122262267 [Penaeus japonicus]